MRISLGGPTDIVQPLAVLGLLVALLGIALALAMRRLQAERRASQEADVALEWERVRKRIATLLADCQGSTVVLITGFRVPTETAGHALRGALTERWSDRVEVTWEGASHDPHWRVVTTTETVLVTPVLERQWLARMRTICMDYGCRIGSCGVLRDDSSPTQAPLTSGVV